MSRKAYSLPFGCREVDSTKTGDIETTVFDTGLFDYGVERRYFCSSCFWSPTRVRLCWNRELAVLEKESGRIPFVCYKMVRDDIRWILLWHL
ncbi:hypothetical protein SAMN05216388_102640 [Halorientalis persicus]|uniref:Uncharacterized protein n=1 Tax=Halorientalis persicus TaxID=1367881 RepID=A0A1H8U9P4_9EURY|nr:hypothetical protein SAMN05216388_102640 [Halorientalis persicus]